MIISAPTLLVSGHASGPGAVVLEGGRITDVLDHVPSTDSEHTRLGDGILSAGLVDVQLNGFAGHDLVTADDAGWDEVRRALPATGVTSFVGTYITAPVTELLAGLAVAERARARELPGAARVLGIHLEGPFLSAARHGAHDPELMVDPSPDLVERLAVATGLVMVTVAPERDGALAAVRRLTDAGIVVSLGHSDASAAEARSAVEAGARMVTHVFNAMRALLHREPGLAGVSLTDNRLCVGLICDLEHVDATVCELVLRAAPGRTVLVTDAIAATGVAPGRYRLGGADVVVDEQGSLPRRPDGTVAGSNLTLDRAVRNAVHCGATPAEALAAASWVPAHRLLGRSDVGDLAVGAYADLVWWSQDLQVRRTWVGGEPVS